MVEMGYVGETFRHDINPYFDGAENGYLCMPVVEMSIRGPNYPTDVPNVFFGNEHTNNMPLAMPQEEDFRAIDRNFPEVVEVQKAVNPISRESNTVWVPDIVDSPSWKKGGRAPPKRIASLTPGSPDSSKPLGPISYEEKKLPWPTDLESAYMPVGPDISLLDDYYLPNERFPFLGPDYSYEEDLFSTTEPEQAENPYAFQLPPGPQLNRTTQVYVPYRPTLPLSPQEESERPYSYNIVNPYRGNSWYAAERQDFEQGKITPMSPGSSQKSGDETSRRPVLRKPVPKSSGSSSRPQTMDSSISYNYFDRDPIPPVPPIPQQITYVDAMSPERRVQPISLRTASLYSPPITPPISSSAVPPPIPPKHNISPVERHDTLGSELRNQEQPIRALSLDSRSYQRPNMPAPVERPSSFTPVTGLAKPPVPIAIPKRKRWWKRLFSRSHKSIVIS
ncbi:uncharacterized protein H6S33_004018 [Morchella sextelata]|uniref:uncharacterized protein n=1 Tax=Morchella sextelata TaxID=1174677 RepID=UPI001D03843F|nr:uncharacterized protein H6S33_004018 [Morchella sextelata]KAH0606357.1 hypothetical protein H6S33_004018 [Morchella sextelata]